MTRTAHPSGGDAGPDAASPHTTEYQRDAATCAPEQRHHHPMPPDAALNYCPRCGAALEDRLAFGRIRRACPVCDMIIFREHKVAAAMLVIDDAGQVLLVRRAWKPMQGCWSLPAGFVDYNEAPADAAVRECREETGLETEILDLFDLIAGREHPHGADMIVIYRGRVTGGELAAADDAADAGFFSLENLPPLAFHATQQTLARWRDCSSAGAIFEEPPECGSN